MRLTENSKMEEIKQTFNPNIQSQDQFLLSESMYQYLFESAIDAIIILQNNKILECNTGTLNLFGYSKQELIGKSPMDLSPEFQPDGQKSQTKAMGILDKALAGEAQRFQWLHIHNDNIEFDVEVHLNLIEINNKPALFSILRDVSERLQAEETIRKISIGVTEEIGELFFENLMLYISKLFSIKCSFISLETKDRPKIARTHVFCQDNKIIDNVEYDIIGSPCESVLQDKVCIYIENVQTHYPDDKFLKDLRAEVYIGAPLFDRNKAVIGILGIINDRPLINTDQVKEVMQIFAARCNAELERIRMEKELSRTQRNLAIHIENTPLGVIEWDNDFKVIAWNTSAQHIFGYTEKEAFGKHAAELVVPVEARDIVNKIWQKLINDDGGKRSINENFTKNGDTIICDWYNTHLVDNSGKTLGVASLVSDVTDQIKTQKLLQQHRDDLEQAVKNRTVELENVNRELESFSYSVSHDLRSPLRAIDGFSKVILEDYHDKIDENGKALFQRIRANTKRMGELIDNLLNLSRLGRTKLNKQSFDFGNLANRVVSSLRSNQPEHNIVFSNNVQQSLYADRQMIQIIMENLLGNAWKYTANTNNPTVSFDVTTEEDEVIYSVKDNGAGFDMAFVDKLFGAFQRLHGREFEGSGIGLATVQRIVHLHNGRIWTEAETNKGATFYFTIN